jgi:hypothetical protein
MTQKVQIAVVVAGLFAGLLLGGVIPKAVIKEAWRLPIAVICIAAGIAIALIAWSSIESLIN